MSMEKLNYVRIPKDEDISDISIKAYLFQIVVQKLPFFIETVKELKVQARNLAKSKV